MKKIIIGVALVVCLLATNTSSVHAGKVTPTPTPTVAPKVTPTPPGLGCDPTGEMCTGA